MHGHENEEHVNACLHRIVYENEYGTIHLSDVMRTHTTNRERYNPPNAIHFWLGWDDGCFRLNSYTEKKY